MNPYMAGLGGALYLRMTVLEVGDQDTLCDSCNKDVGQFQYGVIIDDIGVQKQRIADYCVCKMPICAGCNKD